MTISCKPIVTASCKRPIPYKKRILARLNKDAQEQLEPLDLSFKSSCSTKSSCSQASSGSNSTINSSTSSISNGILTTANGMYQCPECTHTFVVYERLRAHQRRHRIKASGRYTCEECNKSFVQQSSLITHKRIHTGERPYHCEVCNNSYGDLSTFTKHKRTHSGEKPYECQRCSRKFSQSGNCLRHTRSVHESKRIRTPRSRSPRSPANSTTF